MLGCGSKNAFENDAGNRFDSWTGFGAIWEPKILQKLTKTLPKNKTDQRSFSKSFWRVVGVRLFEMTTPPGELGGGV